MTSEVTGLSISWSPQRACGIVIRIGLVREILHPLCLGKVPSNTLAGLVNPGLRIQIPYPYGVIDASGNECCTIGSEGNAGDGAGVSSEWLADRLMRGDIPHNKVAFISA